MCMKKRDFIVKISSFFIFYRWHPEVALRYLPFVAEIEKRQKIEILEVGSGGLGIAPYLGREVVGVDKEFDLPFHPLLRRVKASALKLPFQNSSFDLVLSSDMLEHLEKTEREKAISEMLRVAKSNVFIGLPCGNKAHQQDIFLDNYYRQHHGKKYHFLDQQVKYGLPEKKEICDTIYKAAGNNRKKVKITVKGNENLGLRLFLMKGWVSDNLIVNIIFRKIFLLAIPFFRLMNQNPAYRQLFFITIQNENHH